MPDRHESKGATAIGKVCSLAYVGVVLFASPRLEACATGLAKATERSVGAPLNELRHGGQDGFPETLAGEGAVVTHAVDDQVFFPVGGKTCAERVSRFGLAAAGDVILAAFDGQQ